MDLGTKLIRFYFNRVYNPVYDLTTAQRSLFQKLQTTCIDKFTKFNEGDTVLCAGVGTGNEIINMLKRNSKVSIVGVDYSGTALRKASKKALLTGKSIRLLNMDIQSLEFVTGSFDKVLCIHVMDFVQDDEKATAEIIRVLKRGGEFVITYPSEKENSELGINLFKDSLHQNLGAGNRIKGISRFLAQTVMSTVYLPLLLRSKRKCYSSEELQRMFVKLVDGDFQIEAYPTYQDFIVYGRK
ncbi:class I SAM-dependent methyltransferase [Chloroflexota bacterium]